MTFAEDIASFANTTGGILFVGISDNPWEIVGLSKNAKDVENQLKDVRSVIENNIEYAGDIVTLHQVTIPEENGEKLCLVVIIAQAHSVVGVHDGQHNNYKFPIRQETGIARISRNDVVLRKPHVKSDNYDFIRDCWLFLRDN